jgi:hypothetical protein
MFQNAGEKGERHPQTLRILSEDAPTSAAGMGQLWENDRPPIIGRVGRESGQVRLRVVKHTDKETLVPHVHDYKPDEASVYTDEWRSTYEQIARKHL